jgi:glucokinase
LVTPPELLKAEASGELWARDCVRDIARDLAIATASLVNIFEPEMVVYGGGLFTTGGGSLIPLVKEEIRNRCFASSQKGLEIVASSLAGHAGVLGAASLVI